MANELKEKHQRLKKVRTRNIVLNSICILLAGSGIWWTANYFWRYINYEVTNDAFVDQYIAPLNIRASGYIKEVRFKEHQYVHQGDTLLILDDREYRIKVKEAEAALIDAQGSQDVLRSGIETSHTNIAVQDANIAEAKAKLWQLEQDYHRFERLLKEESIPEQQYEQSKAAFEAAQARYQALVEQKKAAFSQFTETSKKTTGAEAAILRKEADLDLARLNLSYTVITAPYDGHVGRRTLEPGQYVQAGQTISYLVRDKDKWITANYKETQIPHIYIGQKVRIKVDALPGKIFNGEVTAISDATGSKYSLVPTDNSAGNFVKVQQRIPVRIDLENLSQEDTQYLRAGMMVETEAWGTDPPMGAGLVRIDLYLHRYPSGHDAKRLVHRQYAGGIKHARHEHRGYNHGILRGSGGNGGILSDYPEDTGSLLHQILIVGGFSRPVLPKLDLCPLPERRHIDRL